ncbi:aspartic peptidase domain-containing protein [Triangularia setosa]|uniref:Aspartic peptidase domain-containing protein n=1 Tax=Triangularia setosa TaxID=2587417 RepID=A0AAN6WHG5_9PEZI|nr:aspartic peptidase domain-containing protein [Podospora setosa]
MVPAHTRLSTLAVSLVAASATTIAHVLLPFSQHHERNDNGHHLSAREDGTTQLSLTSDSFAYVVNAEVGTPAQKVKLLVSPNAGDSWVMSSEASECVGYSQNRDCSQYTDRYPYNPTAWGDPIGTPCTDGKVVIQTGKCSWGAFNSSLSSTFLTANHRYSSFYPSTTDGSVSGANITDHLKIGDLKVEDYPMGLVTSATRWIGVLGLGFNSSQSSYSSSYSTAQYTNFIDRLIQGGKSKSQAYSMWLDNAEGKSGGLLFGAVDKSRYTGDLVRMSGRNEYVSSGGRTFGTIVNGINGTKDGEALTTIRTHDFPLDVSISPGDVYSFFPRVIADQIAEAVGATWNTTLGGFVIACDGGGANAVQYQIELGGSGGPILHVETSDLIVPASIPVSRTSSSARLSDPRNHMAASNLCYFGIQKRVSSYSSSYSDGYSNIGSSLLRRSYLVFDLTNHEIAIAKTQFPSGGEKPSPNIVSFDRLGARVPGAKLFKVTCTSYYGCSDDSTGAGGGYDDEDENNNDWNDRGSDSGSGNGDYWSSYRRERQEAAERQQWQQVAIGLGVSGGILLVIAVAASIVVCRRIRRQDKALDEEGEGSDADSDMPVGGAQVAVPNRRSSPPVVPMPVIEEKQEAPEVAPDVSPTTRSTQLPPVTQLPALSVTQPIPESQTSDRGSVILAPSEDPTAAQTQAPIAPAPASTEAVTQEPPTERPVTGTLATENTEKGKEKEGS